MVADEFLHPANLALVLRQNFVVLPIFNKMFFTVVDLSAVLKLEGAKSLKRLEKNLLDVLVLLHYGERDGSTLKRRHTHVGGLGADYILTRGGAAELYLFWQPEERVAEEHVLRLTPGTIDQNDIVAR